MQRGNISVGYALPGGRVPWWLARMARALGPDAAPVRAQSLDLHGAGGSPDGRTLAASPSGACRADGGLLAKPLAKPLGSLLALQRALSRPKNDVFRLVDAPGGAGVDVFTPDVTGPGVAGPGVTGPDAVLSDLLVLPPGLTAGPQLLARLPLGVLEIQPVTRADFGPGWVAGRVLWRRAGQGARVACETFTSVQGPMPLAWAAPHAAKLALMPARFLKRLALEGEACWRECPPAPETATGAISAAAAIAEWTRLALNLCGHALWLLWRDVLHRRQWHLAVRPGNADPARPDFASAPFTPLLPPKGVGWADPVAVERGGERYLFIEEIPPSGRGVISVMRALPGGGWSAPRRVLEEPFHLSYPYVFEHDGQLYMIPETSQAGQVRLYRAQDFPGGWVLDRVLLDGLCAVDATPLEHEGRWWLFVNVRPEGGSSWDELHLYAAPSPLGPYEPHPLNPVVSDARRARPAGPVLRAGGRLYRPAQDCSGCYGRALAVMEIERMDMTGYRESQAARLEPGLIPGSFCLHTLVAQAGLEIVDGQRLTPFFR